ncbi:MAG: heme exporter protein CcmD [Pseudomonadota bacterium]
MESLTHAPFIAAAYGIAFGVLAGLALRLFLKRRKIDQDLAALEAQQPRRRRRSDDA